MAPISKGDYVTDTAQDVRKRVRLSFDVSEEFRRRVRLTAAGRDMTLTELLIQLVSKGLAEPEDDGRGVCRSFSHPREECPKAAFDSIEGR